MCREAHRRPLPPQFVAAFADGAGGEAAARAAAQGAVRVANVEHHLRWARPALTQLGIAPLVREVLAHMRGALGRGPGVDGARATRLAVYAGHDSTLMPLLHWCGAGGLDLAPSLKNAADGGVPAQKVGDWPPYCSYLVFELLGPAASGEEAGAGGLKKATKGGGGGLFVRVLFNGRELVLPGQTGAVCPFKAFVRLVEVEQAPAAAELKVGRSGG